MGRPVTRYRYRLSELQHTDPADERFAPKVTVLIENARHHVREEEHDLFPAARTRARRTRPPAT